MHGQKKRRRRALSGTAFADGMTLDWELASEPQSTSDGAQGLQVSVRAAGEARRELVIEYPFDWLRFHPQRPILTPAIVEASIREAIDRGWDPMSRGRAFRFLSPLPLAASTRAVPRLKDRVPISAR